MAKFKRNNLQLKTNQKVELGDNQESVIKYDGSDLKLTNNGGEVSLDGNGITLNSGVAVNEFSDGALGTSNTKVPTQNAVKTYVDTQIGLGIETGNHNLLTGDTTADIVFVQQQGSSKYSIGYSIINTVDNPPLLFVSGVFEKTVDGFKVMFSSPMDTDNYILSWIVTDAELGSSSSRSSSRSSSSSSSASAAPQWLDYTDISYWTLTGFGASWDGSKYNTTQDTFTLTPLGGWEVGFRPTKVRITWTDIYAWQFSLTINTGIVTTPYSASSPVLAETLDFSGGDMVDLVFDGNVKYASYDVNKIEFYA